jgi:hypothetical protein
MTSDSPRSSGGQRRAVATAWASVVARWRDASRWGVRVPLVLLVALVIGVLTHAVVNAGAYGLTWDEWTMDSYGGGVLHWYASLGADTRFYGAGLNIQYYGPLVETVTAVAQHLLPFGHWHVRAEIGAMIGVLGVVGIALVGRQLAGWWGALLAATGLALYPRYIGAIANNSKDVPLTVAMILILWATIRLVRRWDEGTRRRRSMDAALLGALLGVGICVRSIAAIWIAMLGLLLAGWWLRNARRVRAEGRVRVELAAQAVAVLVIGGVAYAIVLATWPYVFLHPATGLVDAVRLMSRYPWPGSVLFDGAITPAEQLPWRYAPQWLVVGSPPVTVALALVGVGFIGVDVVRRRVDTALLLTAGLFLVPLALVTVGHPTLYNGLRQFLFLVPGMVLLGAVAVVRIVDAARRSGRRSARYALAVGVVLAVAVGHAEALVSVIRMFPFEYAYFSPVAGGIQGAHERYETDYWRSCDELAIRWVGANRADLGVEGELTLASTIFYGPPLPPGLAWAGAPSRPDVWVISAYSRDLSADLADYRTVHVISVEGVPLCSVAVRPDLAGKTG